MSDAPAAAKSNPSEFTCSRCAKQAPVVYGWLRCWQCSQAARNGPDGRTMPALCSACCRATHT